MHLGPATFESGELAASEPSTSEPASMAGASLVASLSGGLASVETSVSRALSSDASTRASAPSIEMSAVPSGSARASVDVLESTVTSRGASFPRSGETSGAPPPSAPALPSACPSATSGSSSSCQPHAFNNNKQMGSRASAWVRFVPVAIEPSNGPIVTVVEHFTAVTRKGAVMIDSPNGIGQFLVRIFFSKEELAMPASIWRVAGCALTSVVVIGLAGWSPLPVRTTKTRPPIRRRSPTVQVGHQRAGRYTCRRCGPRH